jgi:NADPH:quinone reductase-like Zn-dependent oxidoreductase
VLAAGADVDDVTAGDVVFGHVAPLPGGSGFCAARALVTAAQVALRSEAMTLVDAAALPIVGLTATQALDALALHSGDRLLITGAAGGTGALALQLAARRGVRIVVTASTAHRDRLLSFGADEVLDYHEPEALRARGGSFDAALVAARGTATDAIDAVRAGGRLCSITSDAPPGVRGISTRNVLVQPDATALASLAQLVTRGELILAAEPASLADAPTVFTEVIAGHAAGAKRVVVIHERLTDAGCRAPGARTTVRALQAAASPTAAPTAVSASRTTGCSHASCGLRAATKNTTAVVIPAVPASCGRPSSVSVSVPMPMRTTMPTGANGNTRR